MADGMMDMTLKPTEEISVRDVFGIDTDMKVKGFAERTDRVPDIDPTYKFDPDTTLAILAGFAYNRRVMIQGYHGTGKSTHIEQVAARLNWPCVRVNLDSHISRIDLIGKDAIKLRDGKQVTEFHEGILPWALRNPVAIVFDEYDAGRADVMFVIQRVLEHDGKLTLLDQNEIITPNPSFRLFATSNTVGLGDTTGLYHGVQQINQAQMDRWSLVATLNYLSHDAETAIVLAKSPHYNTEKGRRTISPDGDRGRPDPDGIHERRPLDRHEPAHGHQLGPERRDLPQHRLRLPADLPQQMRRAGAPDRGRVLPALLRRGTARKRCEPGDAVSRDTSRAGLHIGLIGGIGVAATVVYYQRLTAAVERLGGRLELTIVHADVHELIRNNLADDRAAQAEVYARLIDRLAAAGCDCAAITSLGGHFCFDEAVALSALPLVSAVAPLDAHFAGEGLAKVGLLGTRVVMRTGLYGQLAQTEAVALEAEIEALGQLYQDVAVAGQCTEAQRAVFLDAGRRMIDGLGAEAIVLAGTDLNLAFDGQAPGYRVIDALDVHVALLAELATGRRGLDTVAQ